MTALTGRLLEIASGRTDLPMEKVIAYRKLLERQGYELPPLEGRSWPPGRSGRRSLPVRVRGCVGCSRTSNARKAWSFAKTMAAWALDGLQTSSDTERAERLSICAGCPLSEEGWCRSCGCHIAEKVIPRVSYCPVGRWFVERPVREFAARRNLMMHIMPVAENGVWQWNVRELLRRIDEFDGKRVIAVLTPEPGCKHVLDSVEVVQTEFRGTRIDEWIVRRNNPQLREVVTWPHLLESLKSETGVTFACHAKGVTHQMESVTIRWATALWQTCLDSWLDVERALQQYSMAGSFKRHGRFLGQNWHYSGTFYWFRNDDVFSGNWRNVPTRWWGNESWPAVMFPATATACLFLDDAPDPYKQESWDQRIANEWRHWCAARELPCPI